MKLGISLALAVVAVAAFALFETTASTPPARRAHETPIDRFEALPATPKSALQIGRPEPLASGRYLARFSVVSHPTPARAEPRTSARIITTLATSTPDDTPNALTVLRAETDGNGSLWVRVRLPILPNGTAGWVRRRALGAYQTTTERLVVDRKRLTATLYRNGKSIFRAPIGVGTDSWPTPPGEYLVRSELTRYASPFYGPIAFGTTARSAVLTDWPGGGFVGIHGTSSPELIPGHISHGCVRLRNPDIVRLASLMPVGTPLTIE